MTSTETEKVVLLEETNNKDQTVESKDEFALREELAIAIERINEAEEKFLTAKELYREKRKQLAMKCNKVNAEDWLAAFKDQSLRPDKSLENYKHDTCTCSCDYHVHEPSHCSKWIYYNEKGVKCAIILCDFCGEKEADCREDITITGEFVYTLKPFKISSKKTKKQRTE